MVVPPVTLCATSVTLAGSVERVLAAAVARCKTIEERREENKIKVKQMREEEVKKKYRGNAATGGGY